MSHQNHTSICVLAVLVIVAPLALLPAGAQGLEPAADSWNPPHTAWGDPDIQGTFTFRTITPLERPSALVNKQILTEEEAAEFEKQTAERHVDRPPREGSVGGYNQFWFERGTEVIPTRQTSLIVDPPDGRIPYTEEAIKQRRNIPMYLRAETADSYTDRSLADRCIMGFNSGPPMTAGGYNNNVQIWQISGYVVLLNEMVHDTRIIPTDGRPHLNIRQWAGDSRGHWEGNTLVVETTNFLRETSLVGSTADTQLVERFTRIDADTIMYEFTVEDPNSYTRPWTARMPLRRMDGSLFEYACHEGNYSLYNILAGARAKEKAAEEAKTEAQ